MASRDRGLIVPTRRYWIDAFRQEVETIWGRTPFEREIPQICYEAFLASFLGDDPNDVEDRRAILWQWLKGPFNTDADSALRKHYQWLPSDHFVDRVLASVCSAYNDAPTRTFSLKEAEQKEMERLYREGDANAIWGEVYPIIRMMNVAAVRPIINWKEEMEFRVLTADLFRVRTDPANPSRVAEMWIPIAVDDRGGKQRSMFRVWRDDYTYIADHNGNEAGEVLANPYGRIPYVFPRLQTSRKGDFYGGGLFKLAEACVRANALTYHTLYNVTYNAITIWFAQNMEWDEYGATLDPGEVIAKENVKDPEEMGGKLPPDLSTVSPDAKFSEIDLLNLSWRKQAMKDHDVPDYEVEGGAPESGFARFVKRLPLIQRRKKDENALRRAEQELAEMVAIVANVDGGTRLPEDLPDYYVDYVQEDVPQEPTTEFAMDVDMWKQGFNTSAYMVRKWGGIDRAMTEEEALAYLVQQKDLMAKFLTVGGTEEKPAVVPGGSSGPADGTDPSTAEVPEE
jgi:hypothetical protein